MAKNVHSKSDTRPKPVSPIKNTAKLKVSQTVTAPELEKRRVWTILRRLHLTHSWGKIQAIYFPKVKRGTLQRIATSDYFPKRRDVLQALGVPEMHLAPVCPTCGEVHISKRCPAKRKTASGPRRNWKKAALTFAGLLMFKKG